METPQPQNPKQETQTPVAHLPSPDPFLESAGHLADDPFWDEMMASIRRHRLEMDAAWDHVEP
jgi:tRNA(fMet)-specific endonuclease VapC